MEVIQILRGNFGQNRANKVKLVVTGGSLDEKEVKCRKKKDKKGKRK